jgi:hypothetical protein
MGTRALGGGLGERRNAGILRLRLRMTAVRTELACLEGRDALLLLREIIGLLCRMP